MSGKRQAQRSLGISGQVNTIKAADALGFGGDESALSILQQADANRIELVDGSIQIGVFTLTPVGLRITSTEATEDNWKNVGAILRRLEGALQWLIGDWMAYGERKWGTTYQQVSELTGYDEKTLRQYAWVAANVDLSVRTDKLSFTHHQLVASLTPDLQQQWLDWASEADDGNPVSVAKMRKAMNGEEDEEPAPSPLASRSNRQVFNRVWRALQANQLPTREDVDRLEQLVTELKRLVD